MQKYYHIHIHQIPILIQETPEIPHEKPLVTPTLILFVLISITNETAFIQFIEILSILAITLASEKGICQIRLNHAQQCQALSLFTRNIVLIRSPTSTSDLLMAV